MFEIEKMEKEFDYSLVDNETADFLRSCEYEMNGIAEDARLKFGRVLKNVQEKLSNYHNGVFVKWYESGGLNKNDVYYSINLYEISRNLENSKKDNFLNAPKTLQKEVMKKNAPEELKDKVFSGDITTNKEYQELKRKLREVEQAKQQAESQVELERQERERLERENRELSNQKPKVITEQVIKEVTPKHVESEIKQLKRMVESSNQAFKQAEEELKGYRLKNTSNFNEEEAEKELKKLRFEAEKSVLRLTVKVNRFLEEISPFGYMEGEIATSSAPTKEQLQSSLEHLKNFIRKMETSLKGRIEI